MVLCSQRFQATKSWQSSVVGHYTPNGASQVRRLVALAQTTTLPSDLGSCLESRRDRWVKE